MKCPNCQFENRKDAKFGSDCGSRFEIKCPDCQASNRPNARFCDECGHDFRIATGTQPEELSFDEKIEKIQKYLPGGLTEKISKEKITPELVDMHKTWRHSGFNVFCGPRIQPGDEKAMASGS